jgi:hypothetical protein
MIWLTWRQHRLQLLFGTVVLALITTLLLVSGFGIASTFRSSGLAGCLAVPGRNCGDVQSIFSTRYSNLQFTIPLFLILPALIGVFWGAPLVAREVEQGTHRLAWTQGISRLRWAGTKIAALSAATVVGAAVLTWVLSWWSRPFVAASGSRFGLGVFDLRGVVPVAYAFFALAVGVAAGTVIRRTVPAMGASLGIYAVVRLGVELWLRPHYASPIAVSYPWAKQDPRSGLGDWVLSSNTFDRAGHLLAKGQSIDFTVLGPRCPGLLPPKGGFPDKGALEACVQRIGVQIHASIQPGNRYWLFQGIETAIFVALALGLLGFSLWWLRRRVA